MSMPNTLLGHNFSGLVGFAYIVSCHDKSWFKRIPVTISLSWLLSIPTYFFLLSKQSSHLGHWHKPNGLIDILANYNDLVYVLSIIFPLAGILFLCEKTHESSSELKKQPDELRVIFFTTSFWFVTPLLFWVLSNLSPLNLFVDRYFIPKEIAAIFLIALIFYHLFRYMPRFQSPITALICFYQFSIY